MFCPKCGAELIRLEPYVEGIDKFWCHNCNIDITVDHNLDDNDCEDSTNFERAQELAHLLCHADGDTCPYDDDAPCDYDCHYCRTAVCVLSHNYRKASEVADEIIDTIKENFEPGYGGVVEFKNLLKQLRANYGGRAK